MKIFNVVWKIVAALAAVAGIAFVVVKYGDKIVAWFKKVFGDLFYCDCEDCECDGDCDECECDCCECEEVEEEVVEEEAEAVSDAEFEA